MDISNQLPNVESMELLELLQFTSMLCDDDSNNKSGYLQLDSLFIQVKQIAQQHLSLEARWAEFQALFYEQWQFSINEEDYFSIDSNNLFYFLETRLGNNALSTILVHHLLDMLELQPEIIDFPGPFVLQLNALEHIKVDPLTGKEMSIKLLNALVRGHLGDHIHLTNEHLAIATAKNVKKRFLVSLKQACLLEDNYHLALQLSEMLLELLPDDPNIIMERGFILQQLDYATGAVEDFNYFVEQCPDHPNSDVLKIQIDKLKEQFVITH